MVTNNDHKDGTSEPAVNSNKSAKPEKSVFTTQSLGRKKEDPAVHSHTMHGQKITYTSRIKLDKEEIGSYAGEMVHHQPNKGEAPYLLPFETGISLRFSLVKWLGELLYILGYSTEYIGMKVWRVLRDGGLFLGQILALFFGTLLQWLVKLFQNIWKDVSAPFVNFAHRRRQLAKIRQKADELGVPEHEVPSFFKIRVKTAVQLLASLGAYVMPLVAAGALVFIVSSMVNMKYALAVEIEGQVLGYVTDQTVVSGAKGLLFDRIRLAEGQEITDWQLNPTYRVARATEFSNAEQLANKILLTRTENSEDLVQATGIYIDDQLVSVTENGQQMEQYLDSILQEYRNNAPEGAQVSFVHNVQVHPENEDIFFASSVQNFDTVAQKLQQNVKEPIMIVANGSDSLSDIAVQNDLPQGVLSQRNPDLQDKDDSFVPPAGKSIVIQKAQPLLQVQVVERVSRIESIPYNTVEILNEEKPLGSRKVIQEGQDGAQEIWEDLVYIDGELTERRLISDMTVVLQAPVEKQIEKGTKNYTDKNVGSNEGGYIFPVPDSTWSSRGMSSYHRGVDINGPVGTPIFAARGGTVIVAGWHYSYGNYIMIDHKNGMVTLYAHNSSLAVTQGEEVEQGQYIAAMGSTGNSSGPHLHLEFQLNGALQNPYNYIQPPEGFRHGWG